MVSRAEKFEEFRKTKQVFYIPVTTGIYEWYQQGFGGEIYLGNSEAEAFAKFHEDMDEREAAFFGFVKGFVTA